MAANPPHYWTPFPIQASWEGGKTDPCSAQRRTPHAAHSSRGWGLALRLQIQEAAGQAEGQAGAAAPPGLAGRSRAKGRRPNPPAGPQKDPGAPSSGRQEDRKAAGAQVGTGKARPGARSSSAPSPARLSMCKLQAPPGLQFPSSTTPSPPQRKRLSPASQPSRAVTPPRRDRPGQASRFCARVRRRRRRRRRWRSGPAAGWARGPAGWASLFRLQNRFSGQRSRPTVDGRMRATPTGLQAALRAAGAAESLGCHSYVPAVGRAAPEALGLPRAGSRKRRRPTLPANRTRAAGGATAASSRGEPWGSGGPACRTGERGEAALARGCRAGEALPRESALLPVLQPCSLPLSEAVPCSGDFPTAAALSGSAGASPPSVSVIGQARRRLRVGTAWSALDPVLTPSRVASN